MQTRVFPLLEEEIRQKSRQLWKNFLRASACLALRSVLIHDDLAAEHSLCDPGRAYQGQGERAFWRRLDFYRCFPPFAWLLYGVGGRRETAIGQGLAGLRTLFCT
ncbi:MAG TPA: hypothetical protein VGF67_18520 [Ktedonobacteraceae bacterium]|jgi:hypothetical protein